MKAIILSGGFGTRLKHIVPNIPKPMAPIAGKPFLHYLTSYLSQQNVNQFVFSIHYLKEQIIEYFSNIKNSESSFEFAVEDKPLGTGGAIINSINLANLTGDILVLNGDTFLEVDIENFVKAHKESQSSITLALREVADTSRYGRVEVNGGTISKFTEKGIEGKGFINAGSYIINSNWLKEQIEVKKLPEAFSFEADFLYPFVSEIKPAYYTASNYFIDIGVPEDYARAQTEIPHIANEK